MHFAFISRHTPTQEQHSMAESLGHTLTHVGDADAFDLSPSFLYGHPDGPFEGAVVVHPVAAMNLCREFAIGVFKNENRAPVGAPPQFVPASFHIYDLRGDLE